MYGHSFLFVKPLNLLNVTSLIGVITADVEFYTYSGNQGNALKREIDID